MKEIASEKNETVDIKSTIIKYINYWYYFIICILFCCFVAFLYNRYKPPIYNVSTSLLIRDDNNTQLGAENILEELEIYSGKRNIKNEIVILNSYSLTNQVIEKLGLGQSYYQHGFLKTNELYNNSPFKVDIDSSELQLAGVDFKIQILDKERFLLKMNTKNHYTYNVNTDKNNQSIIANIKFHERCKFGENISTKYFTFKINKTDYFNWNNIQENNKTYSFKLNYRSKLVRAYIKNVDITPITKETSVLLLAIKSKTPKKSTEFLNTLTESYIKNGLKEKNLMATNTINFIDEQLITIKDSLLIIENKLEKFRKKHPNLKIVEKDFGTFFQKQKLDNTLYEHSVQMKYYNSLLEYLETDDNTRHMVSPTSIGITNPELNNLITQLIQQYAKKEELQLITTEKNPSFQAMISQIKHTKDAIIENVKNLISTAKIYEENLENRIGGINETINRLPEVEKEFIILQRNYELNESTVKYLKEKRYEASLAKAGNDPDHKVIDQAKLNPATAISPRKGLSYLLGLFFGLFLPIIYISIRDFFSDLITSKHDIETNTNIPILGLLGHSDKATSFFIDKNPKSVIAESFRSLRTNIQYLASNEDKKIITLTSCVGGEGKTFCSMNLAAIFALSGNKTILIGGDLRKPKLQNIFQGEGKDGLSTYLINKADKKDIILKSDIETLDVICSGPIPPNPAELLENNRMSDLITELNKKYDYVIIDTPPVGLVTDGLILMKKAHINLFVVRHRFTKSKSLAIANNLFKQNIIKNLNIIINDYKYDSSGYGYGYGYGYNYESGGYGYYEET